jgi:hypothetical protein
MPMVSFGEWLPDQPGIAGSLTEALNVVPQAIGYGPLPAVAEISSAASEALNDLFAGQFSGNITLFASSDTKLFTFSNTTLSLSNVSKAGGYSGTRWNFAQFGKIVLAANGSEKIQAYSLGTSALFADVATAAPAAKFVTVIRDFVVAAHTTANPNRVYWSDINDETNWTSSTASQSDIQDIADGGNIQGIVGGEFGIVYNERSISRMSYAGSPLYFQFDTISRGLGCLERNSIAQFGSVSFFLSDDGFYMCDGQSIKPIGAEKVDRWFFNDITLSRIGEMSAAVDPVRRCVFWCYPNSVSGGRSLLIYNWQVGRWSHGYTDAQYIAEAATNAMTLEALDNYGNLDNLSVSLDSRFWSGNKLLLGGVNGTKVVTFQGNNSISEIITGDLSSTPSLIKLARPQIDGGSASVSVASRSLLSDSLIYTNAVAADSENRVGLRSHGRYHRIKTIPTGSWTTAVGIDLDIVNRGKR